MSSSTRATRAALTARRQDGTRGLVLRGLLEVVIIAVLFGAYNAGRLLTRDLEARARANAGVVRDLGSVLPLPSEAQVQGLLTSVPDLLELANRYYVGLHFPVMVAFLAWGFWCRPRAEYTWARNLVVATTFSALALHIAFPLAPPRMFPGWGFVDTMAVWGPSPYDGPSASVANQLAAMPSLHVGWALLVAVVLHRTGPRWLALLGAAHAALTALVVVVTANHWWLDGLVAAGLLAAAVHLLPEPATSGQVTEEIRR